MEQIVTHNINPKSRAWYSRISEATVWIVVIAVLIGVRFLTSKVFDDITTIWFIGLILAFALLYYTVIYEHFEESKRHYIKDFADVVFIGILGTVAKDYSVYLFSLYILPIAAAAFALNTINSLVIATIASLFIAGNVILNSTMVGIEPTYFGIFQIGLLVILTLFTRALALQLREEQGQRRYFENQLRDVDKKMRDVEAVEQEFVSLTTHQLNTPLSIIRGYTSMLLDGDAGKLNTNQQRYIKEIHDGSLRLTKIIRDLMAVTHLDQDQFLHSKQKPIILNPVIEEVAKVLEPKARQNQVQIIVKPMTEKFCVMANQTQISEAINNLIDNAIKYSPIGGKITVTAERTKNHDHHDHNELMVTIADSGMGIPKDEQGRIFQRFYRASNIKKKYADGDGLGLYIVKRIIEYHSGSISFTSEESQGTVFTIRLPLLTNKGDAQ